MSALLGLIPGLHVCVVGHAPRAIDRSCEADAMQKLRELVREELRAALAM